MIVSLPATTLRAQSLEFDRSAANLGVVKSAGNLAHRFRFSVGGKHPVEILEVRPSCGCLRPRLDRKRFEPGSIGEIELGIHATSQKPGKHRFTLAVTTREDRIRTYELHADVELVSDVSVEPSNLLAYVQRTASIERTISISDRRDRGWRIISATATDPRIEVRVAANDGDPRRRMVAVRIGGEFDPGRHESVIELRTDDPEYALFEIPVTVAVEPRLSALPGQLAVPRESLQEGAPTRVVLLRDSRGAPIRVESAVAGHPGIGVEVGSGKSMRAVCTLRFDRSKIAPPVLTDVRVRVAEPEAAEIIIPVRID